MRAIKKLVVFVMLVSAVAASVIPALASGKHSRGKGRTSAALRIKGGSSMKINKYIKDAVHWVPGTVAIASGGKLTITNQSPDPDPHTFSIVQKAQLPHTFDEINECKICGEIAKSHGVNPAEHQSGPPPIPTVDVNNDGFNEPGDSQFIGPHQTVSVTITAKPGTKLYFMCAVHPWMQGVVKVVK
jgi:hypothetical protein